MRSVNENSNEQFIINKKDILSRKSPSRSVVHWKNVNNLLILVDCWRCHQVVLEVRSDIDYPIQKYFWKKKIYFTSFPIIVVFFSIWYIFLGKISEKYNEKKYFSPVFLSLILFNNFQFTSQNVS